MKKIMPALTGMLLAILTIILFRVLFIRPCNSFSSASEKIQETRCKCLGKTFDFANFLGDPNIYSSGAHYDQCVGVVYKRSNL